MKKITAIFLLFVMIFPLAACGSGDNASADSGSGSETKADVPSGDQGDILFEKTVSVGGGTDVVLDFFGTDGAVEKIGVTVNGVKSSDINVFDASEKVIGRDEAAESDDPEFGFFTEDMNFDGYLDFGIQAWKKDGATPYYCWFWNTLDKNYVFGAELENPMFDIANSKIYCDVMENGTEYINVYTVANGSLSLFNSFSVGTKPQFVTDISAYEPFMDPVDRDGYLLLVNYDHTLDENYIPEDLTDINNTRQDGRATQQMRYAASQALYALYIELFAAGYTDVSVTSAYRSYAYQSELFNSYINQEMAENGYTYEEAYDIVKTYSAVPGTSEHQTGLCCDMHNLGEADQAFAKQEAYKWLSDNAWKFGFILRFPEDKEGITKITFEPWHYRFVGRYHAEKIHALGLCLEEYVQLINK